MYIGAPDSITAIVNTFKGSFADWAIAPMPGDGGAAKGALGGGNGYFFKKGLTADQIKAGLKWLAFENLTPGQGQFNYVVAEGDRPAGRSAPAADLEAGQRASRSRTTSSRRPTATSTWPTTRSTPATR